MDKWREGEFYGVAAICWCLVFCLSISVAGCNPSGPNSDGRAAAVQFVAEYRQGLGEAFQRAADSVRRGDVADDAELLELLRAETEAARVEASRGLGEHLERRLSNGKLSREDADVLEELASGFGGAR